MQVAAGEMPPLTPAECWAGSRETAGSEPLRPALLEHLLARVERALAGIRHSTRPEDIPWKTELESVREGLITMQRELKQDESK